MDKDDYVLLTPCCKTSSMSCYILADYNSIRAHETEAERQFSWCRKTIQKGQREINGENLEGDLSARGRKKSEYLLPNLLTDIKAILDPISQADPSFRSDDLYSPITAKEVRRRLIVDKGYESDQLPTERTINTKMKDLGFKLKKIQKAKPLKKIDLGRERDPINLW